MTEILSTTTSNDTKEGFDIKEVVNNSLTQGVWDKLPSGRNLSDDSVEGSCHILKTNSTLALLIPGWEGIPTNIVVNIFLFVVSLRLIHK